MRKRSVGENYHSTLPPESGWWNSSFSNVNILLALGDVKPAIFFVEQVSSTKRKNRGLLEGGPGPDLSDGGRYRT